MGLAVYNSIILDIHFPPVCYRKLLSPAVVPYNLPKATVGVTKATLPDLAQVFPVRFQFFFSTSHNQQRPTPKQNYYEHVLDIPYVCWSVGLSVCPYLYIFVWLS